MKQLLLVLLMILALFLMSCGLGNETPILNGEEPYVVSEICQYNETHSIYYNQLPSQSSTHWNFFGSWYAAMVLPTGYYNIGDTIIIHPKQVK